MSEAKGVRNTQQLIAGGADARVQDSNAKPWYGDYVFSSGDLVEDLTHNFFLETDVGSRSLSPGLMPDTTTSSGVITEPPPVPVRPTRIPTANPSRTMVRLIIAPPQACSGLNVRCPADYPNDLLNNLNWLSVILALSDASADAATKAFESPPRQ